MHHILTKEEAWIPREDESYKPFEEIPGHRFRFRRRWFLQRNCCTFSTFLPARFPNYLPWNVLTIGVFEGAQEVWLMQHVLNHPNSRLYCVDPWASLAHHKQEMNQAWVDKCYENAKYNLSPWASQVTLLRGKSQEVLPNLQLSMLNAELPRFDLIIIDGDHDADPVYQDAVNSYALVKRGGWLMFDDVRNRVEKKHHVREGLQRFLDEYGMRVKQAWSHRYMECYERVE